MQSSDSSSLEWWQKVIIYQVYPRSFHDSNSDGIGDLPGLLSRVDHFVDIGVGAVWLSPFYPSPQFDFGYDISDFCDVDPMYGTLEDFDNLVHSLHEKDIKVILDFVPGHSSHLHPWFQKSVNKEEPYTDYYVWHNGKLDGNGERVPPNNWLSVFGGPAWTWCVERQQFYYRPFLKEQPKLNYRCPSLRTEMKHALKFWLDRGVDGFRVDAISFLVKVEDKSLDEPINPKYNCPPHLHNDQLIQEWANVLETDAENKGKKKLLLLETYEESKVRNKHRQFGGHPFNMDLILGMKDLDISGKVVKNMVDMEYANLPSGAWPTFVLGNHDNSRISNRHGSVYKDAFNILLLTLKGTPTTYYGEEIGMVDIELSFEDTQDTFGKSMGPDRYKLFSRDPERSPMQWDDSARAGFTKGSRSWLPVHSEYAICNVKGQANSKEPTTLKLYKTLAKLRKQPAFESGSIAYAIVTPEIFSYIREDLVTSIRYLIALNFGKKTFAGNLGDSPVHATSGTVAASTCDVVTSLMTGQHVHLHDVTLQPGDGLVIKLETNR